MKTATAWLVLLAACSEGTAPPATPIDANTVSAARLLPSERDPSALQLTVCRESDLCSDPESPNGIRLLPACPPPAFYGGVNGSRGSGLTDMCVDPTTGEDVAPLTDQWQFISFKVDDGIFGSGWGLIFAPFKSTDGSLKGDRVYRFPLIAGEGDPFRTGGGDPPEQVPVPFFTNCDFNFNSPTYGCGIHVEVRAHKGVVEAIGVFRPQ
jgi:hypothetical protein